MGKFTDLISKISRIPPYDWLVAKFSKTTTRIGSDPGFAVKAGDMITKIEFRSSAPPVVVSGVPMKHEVASNTPTEFVGNFIAPEGYVVCKMNLDSLIMLTGPTVPSFGISLASANSNRYNVANGTSKGDFFGLTKPRVNDKPAANVTVLLVPATADQSACLKPGQQVWYYRGPNIVNPFPRERA
jgi:hypothetical protein